MALNYAYSVLSEKIDRAGREIFVSLSIAPLFPTFLGHSRRCCCDAFGHHEDVRYVLNALNFAWWTNTACILSMTRTMCRCAIL